MAGGKGKQAVNARQAYSVSSEKSLKPRAKIAKKPPHNSVTKMKIFKGSPQVQGKKNKKKNKIVSEGSRGNSDVPDEKKLNSTEVKQKNIAFEDDDKGEQIHNKAKEKLGGLQKKPKKKNKKEEKHANLEKNQQKEKKKEKLGGMIFMCSAKSKPDCFRYRVMGVPTSKKELVLSVKPGLKLFLYDFDLRLMYGIYKAASSGGVKLEPTAFNGAFPFQVRFTVHQDCYPLPENVFKKAIKENFNERNKFDTELTVKQVKKLVELFRPAEVLPKAPAIIPQPFLIREPYARDPHIYNRHLSIKEALSPEREDFWHHTFLSEEEYRSHGLRNERPDTIPPPPSYIAPVVEPNPLRHPPAMYKSITAPQGEAIGLDLRLNEREYQACVIGTRTANSGATLVSYANHPHYSSHFGSLIVDPYQTHTRRDEVPSGSYYLSGTERRETYPIETDHYLPVTQHLDKRASYLTESNLSRRKSEDVGRLYSAYASNELSDYNHTSTYQETGPIPSLLAPVSSRYTFAGPSLSYR